MTKKIVTGAVLLLAVYSCKQDKAETDTTREPKAVEEQQAVQADTSRVRAIDLTRVQPGQLDTLDRVSLEKGVKISYFRHGKGAKVKKGDLLKLNYLVKLKDGTVLEGNHMRKVEALPFLVGYRNQTEGWDIALENMQVGDLAEIYLPSKVARGEKSIDGLMPANSDNYITVEILEITKPDRVVDGVKVWEMQAGKEGGSFSDQNAVLFNCIVGTASNPRYYNSWRVGKPFRMKMSDHGIIPGLKKALDGSRKGARLIVLVPSSEAYGEEGLSTLVKPGEALFYYIEVLDILPA